MDSDFSFDADTMKPEEMKENIQDILVEVQN
jgi:hypothetical protein